MEIDLRARTCSEKLGISTTSFQEIKYRLGYRGKPMTLEIFSEIEKVVEDIRKHNVPVTAWYINQYWLIGKNSL